MNLQDFVDEDMSISPILGFLGAYTFPDDFDFYVHSQNPIGKRNIEEYLGAYLNFKRKKDH